jgi:hypothetical protein
MPFPIHSFYYHRCILVGIMITSFRAQAIWSLLCEDSPFKFKTIKNGKTIGRTCTWVATKGTKSRCNLPGVNLTCSSTCGTTCTTSTCADSPLRFRFQYKGRYITRDCSWTANKKTAERCSTITGMSATCRDTCNVCDDTSSTVSPSPTLVPSSIPSLEPSDASNSNALVCPVGTVNEGEAQCTDVSYSTYSPKDNCDSSNLTLQTISTFDYNGQTLIELLGPSDPNDSAAIVITAPHGGNLKPTYIEDRSCAACITSKDSYTKEIALELGQKIIDNYCKVPYVVINHLHRSKLDANREIVEAAQNNTIAEDAWDHFHTFIADAQGEIQTVHGNVSNEMSQDGMKGLLLDVHGYAGTDWVPVDGSPFIQWGYRLSEDSLDPNQYCNLDTRSSSTIGTYTHARYMPNQSYECLVRGPNSLGSRVASLSIDGTSDSMCGMGLPSFEHPSPKERSEDSTYCSVASPSSDCYYYSGGFDVDVHEYLDWKNKTGTMMNTVQMELPRCIRFADGTSSGRSVTHSSFAHNLSIALCSFVKDLFGEETLC